MLRENNEMLKEIISHIRIVSSQPYRDQEDMRQFCINVTADIFTESLEGSGMKDTILNTIKK